MKGGGFQRIGHGGASALARANTLASFDAAQEVGVEVIEFDVRRRGRELVLAHTILHARRKGALRLEEALAHLRAPRFADVSLALDLKHVGLEAAVLEAVGEAGMRERSVFCSQVPPVLDRIRALEPSVRTAISIAGRAARMGNRWGDWRAQVLEGLAVRRWDALMAQHRLIDRGLVEGVSERGSSVYAWTVNERAAIARLRELGVHGIATADPRLFA